MSSSVEWSTVWLRGAEMDRGGHGHRYLASERTKSALQIKITTSLRWLSAPDARKGGKMERERERDSVLERQRERERTLRASVNQRPNLGFT